MILVYFYMSIYRETIQVYFYMSIQSYDNGMILYRGIELWYQYGWHDTSLFLTRVQRYEVCYVFTGVYCPDTGIFYMSIYRDTILVYFRMNIDLCY